MRARTNKDKEKMIKELLKAWKERKHERLGQLIVNSIGSMDLFYIEDSDLIELIYLDIARKRNEEED